MNKFLAAFLGTLVGLLTAFVIAILATWPVLFVVNHQPWFSFVPGVAGVLVYMKLRRK